MDCASTERPPAQGILPRCAQRANKSIQSRSSFTWQGLWSPASVFYFFLRIPISLLMLPICFGMLFIFSIKALSILIMIILNHWPGDFLFLLYLTWFWNLLYLFKVLFFFYLSNVLLWGKLDKMSWVKGAALCTLLGMSGEVWGEEQCSRGSGLRLWVSLSPWTVDFTRGSQFCLLFVWVRMARGGWGWIFPPPTKLGMCW